MAPKTTIVYQQKNKVVLTVEGKEVKPTQAQLNERAQVEAEREINRLSHRTWQQVEGKALARGIEMMDY